MNIVIATVKSWNIRRAEAFARVGEHDVTIITEQRELTLEKLTELSPDYIFFPHWNDRIPKEVYKNFKCIVFHASDLPFGRGGSPIQNLIECGIYETKICALNVCETLDGGDVYIRRKVSLEGGAEEIYIRVSDIVFGDMIPYIIQNNPSPVPQTGEVKVFRRRHVGQSELTAELSLSQIFDYIRMLDAEGYPNAFVRLGDYKMTFTAPKRTDGAVLAHVRIEKETDK